MGYAVTETNISPDELSDMDEAFYCGTIVKIQPIREIDGKAIGKECPGTVTCALKERITEVLTGNLSQYDSWLTHVK
jgi:branched-subunit amino acid aminotransferase/4-amino-4-deoxychorismate lyase